PEPAPVPARAAGVRAQRVAQDADGAVPGLHHLHGIIPRGGAREDDHAGLAVMGRPRAGAAGIEIALDEEPSRLRMRAESDGRHLIAVGAGGDALRSPPPPPATTCPSISSSTWACAASTEPGGIRTVSGRK